jgi:hypothetical protein
LNMTYNIMKPNIIQELFAEIENCFGGIA